MDAASILFVLATVGASGGSQPADDASVKSNSVLQTAPDAGPIHHTAFFAGQADWGPGTESPPPAAAPTYDRYPAATISAGSATSPPPSVVDRTRMAVTESGNALRDGVEAGIQAANRQLYQGSEQVIESTRSAGQEFSEQFQGWAGTAGQPIQPTASNVLGTPPPTTSSRQQVSNPFATAPPAASAAPSATARTRGGVAPPPWVNGSVTNEPDWSADASVQNTSPRTAALGTVTAQTESGWTSINSTIAPPALMVPRLVNTPIAAAQVGIEPIGSAPLQPMVGGSGPGFPVAISANQPVDRSVLAQSQQPPAAAATSDNWAIGWDGKTASQPTQPATIGGRYDTGASTSRQDVRDRDFGRPASERPVTASESQGQPAATPGFDPWADKDPWGDDRSKSATGTTAQRDGSPVGGPMAGNPATGSAAAIGTSPVVSGGTMPAPGTAPIGSAAATVPGPAENQPPWMPLLVVSLSLAGSIGANLFLGWSYMDARQKYRHLVQKTANKFRRTTAAA